MIVFVLFCSMQIIVLQFCFASPKDSKTTDTMPLRQIQYASEGSWDSRRGPFGLATDHTAKRSKEKIISRRAKQS